MITYTEASPQQIHEVFKLYNKQGLQLNAEEIRNAVYHELNLMRALSVAAGDNMDLVGSTPFLKPATVAVEQIRKNLEDYPVNESRYKRTKVLSWLVSMLLADPPNDDGNARMRSTATQIDFLLQTVQENPNDSLRDSEAIVKLITLLNTAMNAHLSSNAWAPQFKNTKAGASWQELQLVASLLGVTIAAVALNGATEEVLNNAEAELRVATASKAWARPNKTQTGTRWEFIAGVALAVAGRLGVSEEKMKDVDSKLISEFGRSGISALLAARDDRIS